jgi:hypothetical protein
MKKALPWILASVSLCFNVFFVFGMVRGLVEREICATPEGRADSLSSAVGADQGQREAILDAEKKAHDARARILEQRSAQMEKIWLELVKDSPDEAVLLEVVRSEGSQGRHALFLEKAKAVMKALTPAQRALAVEFFRKHAKKD